MYTGRENIKYDGMKTRFSSAHQPKNRKQSTKVLTALITKALKKKKREMIVTGVDVETGETRKIKLIMPTADDIVDVLISKALKGDMMAITTIYDRIEGKPIFTAEVDLPGLTKIGFD